MKVSASLEDYVQTLAMNHNAGEQRKEFMRSHWSITHIDRMWTSDRRSQTIRYRCICRL